MITFREIFPKYLKICREYSLNMAEAVDFSMPDAFAKDYLDRIIKKTEKSLNNTCVLYTGRKTKSGYTVIDVRLPGHSRFVPMNVHRLRYMIHTRCIQLNAKNYHVSHLCHTKSCVKSTSDAVTIDTNPGNLFAHPPLRGHTTIYSTIDLHCK
jgi:hypothetical protein